VVFRGGFVLLQDDEEFIASMTNNWQPAESSTHQDAVVSHVIGATVLGFLIEDETAHLLLNIGFIWTIYLDGQMVLLPHPVAVAELEVDESARNEIAREVDLLLSGLGNVELEKFSVVEGLDEIREAEFYETGNRRRISLVCEGRTLNVDTDLANGEVVIHTA
jgi:hypothetical protein